MANELSVFEREGIPSYLQNVEEDGTTDSIAGSSSSNHRISIRGGMWRMVVGGKEIAVNEERSINVVIVRAAEHVSRQFYIKAYDSKAEPTAPDCASSDGVSPDAGVPHPQASACMKCPQNIAGSGQGKSRACRYQQRLAVVLEGDMEGPVYQFVAPAMSIFGEGKGAKMPLQAYGRYLKARGIPVTSVVTEMRFDSDSESPKVVFKPIRALTEEEYNVGKSQGFSPEALSAVTMVVAKRDASNTEGSDAPEKVSAAEETASGNDADDSVTIKREARKPAPTKKSAAEVMQSWGDTDDDD